MEWASSKTKHNVPSTILWFKMNETIEQSAWKQLIGEYPALTMQSSDWLYFLDESTNYDFQLFYYITLSRGKTKYWKKPPFPTSSQLRIPYVNILN